MCCQLQHCSAALLITTQHYLQGYEWCGLWKCDHRFLLTEHFLLCALEFHTLCNGFLHLHFVQSSSTLCAIEFHTLCNRVSHFVQWRFTLCAMEFHTLRNIWSSTLCATFGVPHFVQHSESHTLCNIWSSTLCATFGVPHFVQHLQFHTLCNIRSSIHCAIEFHTLCNGDSHFAQWSSTLWAIFGVPHFVQHLEFHTLRNGNSYCRTLLHMQMSNSCKLVITGIRWLRWSRNKRLWRLL